MNDETLTLNPTALSEARQLYTLLTYLEAQYAATKASLDRLVMTAAGINVNTEDWQLDIDSGILTRTASPAVQSTPTEE